MIAVVPIVWFLAVLATVLFGRAAIQPMVLTRFLLVAAATFVAAVWLTPQANWIGLCVGLLAAWRLLAPKAARPDFVLAGLCAGLAAALHVGAGMSVWLAPLVVVGAAAAGVAILGSARTGAFAAYGLALVAFAAPLAGLIPDIAAGWRAAQALNQAPALAESSRVVPVWTAGLVMLALAAGVLRGLWVRK